MSPAVVRELNKVTELPHDKLHVPKQCTITSGNHNWNLSRAASRTLQLRAAKENMHVLCEPGRACFHGYSLTPRVFLLAVGFPECVSLCVCDFLLSSPKCERPTVFSHSHLISQLSTFPDLLISPAELRGFARSS